MRDNVSPFRKIIDQINSEAININHDTVGLEHVLLGLTRTGGIESKALSSAGANYELLKQYLLIKRPKGEFKQISPSVTEEFKQLMEDVNHEMRRNRDRNNFGYYLLKNLIWTNGLAMEMLRATNVNPKEVNDLLEFYFQNATNPSKESQTPNLDKFGDDLTLKAISKIDGVIGREHEINRIIQVLTRRTKNNPILIGEAGVGKTAIVEGLAKKIAQGQVPDIMRGKKIISLDMSHMVAGTKYRGDFEKRITDTLKEVSKLEDTILFIDEIHTIIGAGASEGGLDASNIMKPYLSKGDLKVIGATTISEYRQYIEKEPALERRMQPIMVEEPSVEETIDIIKGIRDKYESFHKVKISDEVIEEAVKLSDRYLIDRFLPDKAIDVIDEASSKLKVKTYKIPKEISDLQEELDKLQEDKVKAINTQDFEKAAYLRDQILMKEAKLADLKDDFNNDKSYEAQIDIDKVREIVGDWSKVPVKQMTEEESNRYKELDKRLKEYVIGQDYAVDQVSMAIKRARVGLKGKDKPIGSFIFVGPTGVGKTYLAKSLAEELFGGEDEIIRLDMSEYMEKHTVSKLIGSPPGYVGYEEGGQLTDAVRSKPYSVVLFDEIEKAHPDVFNILLHILDEGRLTDSQGTEVDFKNTIIILTSNAGASKLSSKREIGFSAQKDDGSDFEFIKKTVNEELKNLFKPEFLNRLDDIIVFNRLTREDIREVVSLELDDLLDRIEEIGYSAKYSDKVVDFIADKGYDENYGARPLKRAIKTYIEDILAVDILEGKFSKGDTINIGMKSGDISITKKRK
ncbi:MAG: ATP-dependent Clp protease ATP-binding subunit [Tissierellia bacterium]|nr:ATP-dependent Clp protease ATP-binding subunit [Tissierellia bacterium]